MSWLGRAKAAVERWLGGEIWFWVRTDDEDERRRPGWRPSARITLTVHPIRFGIAEVCARTELNAWSNLWGAYVRMNRGEICAFVGLGASAHLTLESPMLRRRLGDLLRLSRYDDRELSLRFFDKAVWWKVWSDSHGWTSDTPRWRDGSWHPLDTIFGKTTYVTELVERADMLVPMPEKSYRGHVEIRRDSWRRPRWPFARVVYRAHIDMTDPVPVPGKGENSWDLGQDAIYGMTVPARTVADAIAAVVKSAMRDRIRRAGQNWVPEVPKDVAHGAA